MSSTDAPDVRAQDVTRTSKVGLNQAIRARLEICRVLPAPNETYLAEEIAEKLGIETNQAGNMLKKLDKQEIVEKVDFERIEYPGTRFESRRHIWRTRADAYEAIQAVIAGSDDGLLPCGHSAFRNLGGELECKVCGKRHTVEEVRER